jgi:hypothetical protein
MQFFGRNRELALLNNLNQRADAQFLILYGRRRIGKTSLIEEWSTQNLQEQEYLYWMATQTSTVNQLRDFSQTILRFIEPNTPVSPRYSYETWDEFSLICNVNNHGIEGFIGE